MMAGLLDMFSDDSGLLGLHLLAAAGPQARPTSFGQRLLGGIGGYKAELTAAEERKQKKAMQELQMGLLNAQIGETNAQGQQRLADIEKKKALEGLLGSVLGGQAAPSQYGVGGGGISLGGVQETMNQRQAGLAGASIDDIAKLKALGGIDLLEQWKTSQTGQKLDAGNYYMKNGQREFLADPTKGINFDGRNVSLIPGAPEAQAAMIGANKTAELSASAPFTLIDAIDAQGVPRKRTLFDVLREQQGGASPQPGPRAPQANSAVFDPMEMARAEAVSSRQPVAYNLGGRSGVLQPGGESGAGLKTGLGPAEKWVADEKRGLMVNGLGETRPMTGAGGKPIGSPAQAESDLRDNKWLTASAQARSLLKNKPTQSLAGTAFDKVGSVVGYAPDGAKEADQLRAIGGWLTSNVPRFEGPQSVRDVELYSQMAASVGDSSLPVSRRLAALDTVDKLIQGTATLNPASTTRPSGGKTVVRTGTKDGRKWVRYSDGSEGYGD